MRTGDFRFNGVVRLTRIGGGYLVFTLVVGFAALNTGNNSLYIALAIMLGALVFSGLASKNGLRGIGVEIVEMDEVFAGQPSRGLLLVENRSRIWPVRDVVVTAAELDHPEVLAVLPRRGHVYLPVTFRFSRRGRVAFHRIDLYTRYPFGLFVKKRRAPLAGEAVVYPRLIEDRAMPIRDFSELGDIAPMNRVGPSGDIFSFREYEPGDSLRHVHWRRSASLGRWVIKEHEYESGRSIEVVLDLVVPSEDLEERFEQLVSEATTIVRYALETGLEVVLIVGESRIGGRGPQMRRAMFERLALVESVPTGAMPIWERGRILLSLRAHETLHQSA